MRSIVIFLYNLVLPLFFIVAFPAWLLKMARRGGIGTGLLERFGVYKGDAEYDKQGVIYIHAVSVGEVLIAVKLIKQWLLEYPKARILLVPTTATGHAVAKEHAPEGTQVIYSPLDFSFILRRVFQRFEPKQIILMESEIWPNMLNVARKMNIPVNVANARLSDRSEKRYVKLKKFLHPMLEMLHCLCAQDETGRQRWINVGVDAEKVKVTGSVKFDQSGAVKPVQRDEFKHILDAFGSKPVVMAISTHVGEEAWIADALIDLIDEIRLVIVPRHSERRNEVLSDLKEVGVIGVLRSSIDGKKGNCLVVDSTGELRDWTAHADLVIVGKSFIGKGGQNPTEAIAAGVPVITGPYMRNFEPLITHLRDAGGVTEATDKKSLTASAIRLLKDKNVIEKQVDQAHSVLVSHQGATLRTVEVLSC